MLTLGLERFETECLKKIPLEVLGDFRAPITFYLSHPHDRRRTLIDACVLHAKDRRMEHFNLMTPENLDEIERSDVSREFFSSGFFHPHCSVFEPSRNRYLIFSELSEFFYRMDASESRCLLLRGKDVFPNWASKNSLFWATFATDGTGAGKFHMTVSREIQGKFEIGTFFTDSDFSGQIPVSTIDSPTNFCPHMTRKIGRKLFHSNFYNVRYSLFWGKLKAYRPELYETVFRMLFEDFVKSSDGRYETEDFHRHFEHSIPFPLLSAEFNAHYSKFLEREKCKDFLSLCRKNYGLEILPGSFFTHDLDTGEIVQYPTSLPTPAHFETSGNGDVYVSCHNFLTFENIKLLGPAAIDRFEKTLHGFRYAGSFSHPTGYRFTSHKTFEFEGKTKICAIGQTERLFLFDVESGNLEYYSDIDPHFAEMPKEERFGKPPIDSIGPIGAFEISSSGRYAFIFSHRGIGIFDFAAKKLLGNYEKISGTTPGGYELSDFYKKSAHCQYLDSEYRI